ncbi:MAG: DUF177 domain-containing protein [Lachnospiraceae bacterium]
MRVELLDIISWENKEMSKQVEIELMSFNSRRGEFPIAKKAPFVLTFTNLENKRLLIQGESDVTITIPCDRCLTDVDRVFRVRVDKEIDLTGEDKEKSMDVLNYMIGTSLDVDQLIFGEILVSWPMKVLCKEDCKGICNQCGINLNTSECQCQRTELDPRMAAIQDIYNKFKEV